MGACEDRSVCVDEVGGHAAWHSGVECGAMWGQCISLKRSGGQGEEVCRSRRLRQYWVQGGGRSLGSSGIELFWGAAVSGCGASSWQEARGY